MKRGREKNRTDNSTTPNGSQATVHPLSSLSGLYTSGRGTPQNLVAEEEEEAGSNSTSSPTSSLDGSFEHKSKYPRDREQDEEEEERRTLLTNEKFLEIIGVSLDTIPTETFDFSMSLSKYVKEMLIGFDAKEKKEEEEKEKKDEREKMEDYVDRASKWRIKGGIPFDPDESFNRIANIWIQIGLCKIDPKTSEIMKKAVDLAYNTKSGRFISLYLNKSLIEASEKIVEGERKKVGNTSICQAVIECFCTSLLYTAEKVLEYYSRRKEDPELQGLDKIKQLNCFVRFYNELNREWVERPMILGAYSEYLQDEFKKTDVVEAWNRMSVDERIHHFKDFGMKLYQADPSCYDIIKDELEKLLKRMEDENRKYIFDKSAEQIRDKGFFGGKKTKNKSKRKSTNKKKSRKSTNKKKSRKSKK